MNDRDVFDSVLKHSIGYSMGSLWQSLTVELQDDSLPFEKRTDIFIRFLRELMQSGRIRLAIDGIYLGGSVDDQLGVLRKAWPSPSVDEEEEMYLWFLAEAPAGVVWIADDGTEIWT